MENRDSVKKAEETKIDEWVSFAFLAGVCQDMMDGIKRGGAKKTTKTKKKEQGSRGSHP